MFIKYSPIKCNTKIRKDTVTKKIDENTIEIDGEKYEFDPINCSFPDIRNQTNGIIIEAYRDASDELYITILRFYTKEWESWYSDNYVKLR
jgi:hypothetical protein